MAKHRHFRIEQPPTTDKYQYTGEARGPNLNIPTRDDRVSHATRLRHDLERAKLDADQSGHPTERDGVTLEFNGVPGFDLVADQLDRSSSGIELSNVRRGPDGTSATVYVPPGKIQVFFALLERCANDTTQSGRAPQGQKLFDSIDSIRRATTEAFWTDTRPFPSDSDLPLWWEVWLRSGNTVKKHEAAFERFAAALGDTELRPGTGFIQFPERLVLLVRGSVNDWSAHPELLNLIAELRQAKDIPTDLVDLDPAEQSKWAQDTSSRIAATPVTAPAVCILDTGVWRDHPLLRESLSETDTHAVDLAWGVSDHCGHGTQVAGLALYGQELQPLVEKDGTQDLTIRLESVKILPPLGANDPAHYGYVTQAGVARAEVAQPHRPRTVCLATTSDHRDQGYPSSWSSAIDAHASGALDNNRRLYVISTGNYRDICNINYKYPAHNHAHAGIEDPAQSWNAITVGAYTEKVFITDPDFDGWSPLAPAGTLSPSSRTSVMWTERSWPVKPDVVVEGGNWAIDGRGTVGPCTDLELLTTTYSPTGRLFDSMRDTSAATAQVARMCAQIQSQYPELWPETVRALIVHSARWTSQMLGEVPDNSQESLRRLLRCYGYGVPDLARAIWSLDNQVSLVAEGELQPFVDDGKSAKSNEMHLHTLPWPVEQLESLGRVDATVRITLSYFIEPSPGRRGWTSKFGYQSHGLRFKLRGPLESDSEFRQRISRASWDDESSRPDGLGEPQQWALGARGHAMTRGSIHSNWWRTSAAELASCGEVAVFPVGGWWKERRPLGMANSRTRYAIVVTIETPDATADLYAEIAKKIAVPSQVIT